MIMTYMNVRMCYIKHDKCCTFLCIVFVHLLYVLCDFKLLYYGNKHFNFYNSIYSHSFLISLVVKLMLYTIKPF